MLSARVNPASAMATPVVPDAVGPAMTIRGFIVADRSIIPDSHDSAKKFFQFLEGKDLPDRPSMRTGQRAFGSFEIAVERRDFALAQFLSRPNRSMTCHRGDHFFIPFRVGGTRLERDCLFQNIRSENGKIGLA